MGSTRVAVPLVCNPRARGGRGLRVAARAKELLARHGVVARLEPTAGPGGAAPLAERLARDGEPLVLVVGGDGTIGEACDGVLRSGARPEMGFLPGGTGNSFLLGFGVATLEEGARRAATSAPRPLDAGLARWEGGERRFVNVFGVGFMARVAALADRRLKLLGGRAYAAAVLPELARLRVPPTRLVLDGEAVEEPLALVAVCNTPHTGGDMLIAPMARPDDGWLDVVALRTIGRAGLLRLFPRIFSGAHVDDPRVLVARAREVRIEPAEPSPLLADGETFGRTPVDVRALPGALLARL